MLNKLLINSTTVSSDMNNIKATLPTLLSTNDFNNTITSYVLSSSFHNTNSNY